MSRKILMTTAASVAIVLAVAAAAYAGVIATMRFTPYASPTSVTVSGSGGFSVTVTGAATTVTCTGTTLAGTATPGTLTGYATITTFAPGTCGAWTVTSACSVSFDATAGQNVNAAAPATTPDTSVAGTAHFGNACLTVSAGACSFKLGGNVPAVFDETPDASGDQTLKINGAGLVATNQSFGCLGLFTGATTSTGTFKVRSTATSIYNLNFVD